MTIVSCEAWPVCQGLSMTIVSCEAWLVCQGLSMTIVSCEAWRMASVPGGKHDNCFL